MRRAAAIAVIVLLTGGAWALAGAQPETPEGVPPGPDRGRGVTAAGAALVPFDACDAVVDYARGLASEQVRPWGLEGASYGHGGMPVVAEAARSGAAGGVTADAAGVAQPESATAPRSAGQGAPGDVVSGTNVQEQGVDEPDIVKTDGDLLAAATPGGVELLDVSSGVPEAVGRHDLDAASGTEPQLLLSGDHLLVMWTASPPVTYDYPPTPEGAGVAPVVEATPVTHLELVDVSDPAAPAPVARYRIDGHYVSARMIDGTVRLAVVSIPTGLDLRAPVAGGLDAEQAALEHNRAAVRSAGVDAWLPHAIHEDLRSSGAVVTEEGRAVDCLRVHQPPEPAGLATTTVLTLDLADRDLEPEDTTAVYARADTVYASASRLYVALSTSPVVAMPAVDTVLPDPMPVEPENQRLPEPMPVEPDAPIGGPVPVDPMPPVEPPAPPVDPPMPPPESAVTTIHAFDISSRGEARYVASGEVSGNILSQWSLSEHEGYLRVAVTEGGAWGEPTSESAVVVLEERGSELVDVGYVDGLGRGERIYAVRFLGDTGYVVTFRQVDPLYTIDLSDPTAPRVTGELKILGYSAYLHPTAPGRLLGVGQDATEQGQVRGAQVSLFDVSNPADPRRLAQETLPGGHTEVEGDHRAFLWWAPRDLAFVPVVAHGVVEDRPGIVPPQEVFAGLVAYHVGDAGIEEAGRVTHADAGESWNAQVRRAIVLGDTLVTVSAGGVQATDLDTFETLGSVLF